MMSYLIGIDVGQSKIGLAISDSEKKIAFPLDVIHRQSKSYGFNQLKRIISNRDIEAFVVGLPYREDGRLGEQGNEVLKYIESLKEYFHIDIITWDERYTTLIAEKALLNDTSTKKKRKHIVDKVAAQLILQSYLDHKNIR